MLIYVLRTICYNGSVTMLNHVDCFKTRELAEKTMAKLKEVNTKHDGSNASFYKIQTNYEIEECQLFEKESEIAILNPTEGN